MWSAYPRNGTIQIRTDMASEAEENFIAIPFITSWRDASVKSPCVVPSTSASASSTGVVSSTGSRTSSAASSSSTGAVSSTGTSTMSEFHNVTGTTGSTTGADQCTSTTCQCTDDAATCACTEMACNMENGTAVCNSTMKDNGLGCSVTSGNTCFQGLCVLGVCQQKTSIPCGGSSTSGSTVGASASDASVITIERLFISLYLCILLFVNL